MLLLGRKGGEVGLLYSNMLDKTVLYFFIETYVLIRNPEAGTPTVVISVILQTDPLNCGL